MITARKPRHVWGKVAACILGALALIVGTAISASATTITETYNCAYTDNVNNVHFYHCNGYWFHNYGYPTRELRIVADQTVAFPSDYHTTRITRIESDDATVKHFVYYCQNEYGGRWQIGTGDLGGSAPWAWDYGGVGAPCDGYGTGMVIRVSDSTGAYVTWVEMNVTNYIGGPGVHSGCPESYR